MPDVVYFEVSFPVFHYDLTYMQSETICEFDFVVVFRDGRNLVPVIIEDLSYAEEFVAKYGVFHYIVGKQPLFYIHSTCDGRSYDWRSASSNICLSTSKPLEDSEFRSLLEDIRDRLRRVRDSFVRGEYNMYSVAYDVNIHMNLHFLMLNPYDFKCICKDIEKSVEKAFVGLEDVADEPYMSNREFFNNALDAMRRRYRCLGLARHQYNDDLCSEGHVEVFERLGRCSRNRVRNVIPCNLVGCLILLQKIDIGRRPQTSLRSRRVGSRVEAFANAILSYLEYLRSRMDVHVHSVIVLYDKYTREILDLFKRRLEGRLRRYNINVYEEDIDKRNILDVVSEHFPGNMPILFVVRDYGKEKLWKILQDLSSHRRVYVLHVPEYYVREIHAQRFLGLSNIPDPDSVTPGMLNIINLGV